ncbi:hypothetical protein [Paenibacillus glycinis]|uniref:Uncharacterized protein n=1 Tax=Paenibacillus glycinis TaxID=2697035 RepID=A0ABW9Y0B9_9BACL|nr:hypothetical protein [Paenibacillus glycinis]NBD27926.1 hypothetical protein [Paenibacillus glycinis]
MQILDIADAGQGIIAPLSQNESLPRYISEAQSAGEKNSTEESVIYV